MSMTAVKALVNNQNILQNFGLVEEIDEHAAEKISGGSVTIRNTIGRFVLYRLDGSTQINRLEPGQEINLSDANNGRRIEFDIYAGSPTSILFRPYTLADGQRYEFQSNPDTANTEDIDLYAVRSNSGH